MANLKRVLWHLLAGTRGGPLRIRIIGLLRDQPRNTNQVATELGVDYKTAQHHLRVLTENRVASPTGHGYGAVFLLTRDMEASWAEFEGISAKVAARAARRAPPAPPPATPPAPPPGGT
jgi:predicted transcriptional regulator